ncbi:MAG: hypothetical protein ACI837_001964 [Crocinitomicaceae bacterium]|jgi:hypothetical protein
MKAILTTLIIIFSLSASNAVAQKEDSLIYDMNLFDSLYSAVNKNRFQVKVAFPFIWIQDLNGNDTTEFTEFQVIRASYREDEPFQIAVNYETSKACSLQIQLQFITEDLGASVYEDTLRLRYNSPVNKLAGFRVPADSTHASIPPGKYFYQVVMKDADDQVVYGAYFNSIVITEGIKVVVKDTTPPPAEVDTIISDYVTDIKDLLAIDKEDAEALFKSGTRKVNRKIRQMERKLARLEKLQGKKVVLTDKYTKK